MEILILIVAMLGVGLILGALAGVVSKAPRPYGVAGDLIIGAVVAIAVGLIDWFVIPALGFSDTLKIVGTITEPPLAVIIVLWLIRRARR